MISTSTKKHDGLDQCDVQKYIDSGKEKMYPKYLMTVVAHIQIKVLILQLH